MAKQVSVLFVCMGNICRSPAADGIFLDYLSDKNMQELILVDSAGTHGYHVGDPADPRMRKAAAARGFDLQSRARKFVADDLLQFELILAMDRDNLRIIEALSTHDEIAQVQLFSDFLDTDSWPIDVPDPYYGEGQGFETVLDMIESACPAILESLIEKLGQ